MPASNGLLRAVLPDGARLEFDGAGASFYPPEQPVPAVRHTGPGALALAFAEAVARHDPRAYAPALEFVLRAGQHAAESAEAQVHNEAAAEVHGPRFALRSEAELAAMPEPEFQVDGYLVQNTTAGLVGATGAGKTFTGLDVGLCIASGRPWHGRVVRSGPVVYVTPEGVGGIRKRLAAWRRHHGVTGTLPLYFVTVPVNLLNGTDPAALVEAIRARLGTVAPVLIVLDTLARAMVGGNENSQEDMAVAVESADSIRRAFGCCLLLVHHSGHLATDRARGSSVLPAALDSILLQKLEDGVVTLETVKQKDHSPLPPLRLKLQPAGDSCVLMPVEGETVSPAARAALLALEEIATEDGATISEWLAASRQAKASFYRARKDLLGALLVVRDGRRYLPTLQGRELVSRGRETNA